MFYAWYITYITKSTKRLQTSSQRMTTKIPKQQKKMQELIADLGFMQVRNNVVSELKNSRCHLYKLCKMFCIITIVIYTELIFALGKGREENNRGASHGLTKSAARLGSSSSFLRCKAGSRSLSV